MSPLFVLITTLFAVQSIHALGKVNKTNEIIGKIIENSKSAKEYFKNSETHRVYLAETKPLQEVTPIDVKNELDKLNVTLYKLRDDTVSNIISFNNRVGETTTRYFLNGYDIGFGKIDEINLQLDSEVAWYQLLNVSDETLNVCEIEVPLNTSELFDPYADNLTACFNGITAKFLNIISNTTIDVSPINEQLGQFAYRLYVCFTNQTCLGTLLDDMVASEPGLPTLFNNVIENNRRAIAVHLNEFHTCNIEAANEFNNRVDGLLDIRLECLHLKFCAENINLCY